MTDQENSELVRIELIFSTALEEDIFSGFAKENIGKKFTKIPSVLGAGCSNPKQGDAVWPQFNTIIIVFCDKAEAEKIEAVVAHVRNLYPAEGVACFESAAKAY